jgi:hypothetical protein
MDIKMKITKKSLIKLIEEELTKHSIAELVPPGGAPVESEPEAAPEKKGAADIEILKKALTRIDSNNEVAPAVEIVIGHIMNLELPAVKTVLKNLRSKLQTEL